MGSDCFSLVALANLWNAYLGGLGSLVVGLNTSTVRPTPQNMIWGNIVEPQNCSWYSRYSTTWQDAFFNSNSLLQIDADSVQWNYGESTSASVVITGWWVGIGTSSGGVTLLSQGVLAASVEMSSNLNAVRAWPKLDIKPISLGD